jgi:phosphatidate phosphatase APP1
VIYISSSEKWRLKPILEEISKLPILTISDIDDFVDRGGIIQQLRQQDKLVFEINMQAAQAARLTISSKLLGLAKRVIK